MIAIALILLVATGIAHAYQDKRYLSMRLFKRGDVPKLIGGTAFTVRLKLFFQTTTNPESP